MSEIWRRCLAEFLGTFTIVFAPVALSAANAAGCAHTDLFAAAVVSGLPVSAMIYSFGPLSGAHFNPAVSLACFALGKLRFQMLCLYILVQLAGGLAAALTAKAIFGVAAGAHQVSHITPVAALMFEFIVTALLMGVICASTADPEAPLSVAALSIGMIVIVDVMIAGSVTGGSMNPARSLGPALLTGGGPLQQIWVYLLGPIGGAIFAAMVCKHLLFPPRQ